MITHQMVEAAWSVYYTAVRTRVGQAKNGQWIMPEIQPDELHQRDLATMRAALEAALSAGGEAQGVAAIETRKVYKGSDEDKAYIHARFSGRGMRISFEYDGHRWAYKHTSFDDTGEYDLLWRPVAAAPAMKAIRMHPEWGGLSVYWKTMIDQALKEPTCERETGA